MGTGPHKIYNKASEFQIRTGTIALADFTSGAITGVFTGLKTLHAAFVSMNEDAGGTTNSATASIEMQADGTVDISLWTEAGAVPASDATVSWMAVGME